MRTLHDTETAAHAQSYQRSLVGFYQQFSPDDSDSTAFTQTFCIRRSDFVRSHRSLGFELTSPGFRPCTLRSHLKNTDARFEESLKSVNKSNTLALVVALSASEDFTVSTFARSGDSRKSLPYGEWRRFSLRGSFSIRACWPFGQTSRWRSLDLPLFRCSFVSLNDRLVLVETSPVRLSRTAASGFAMSAETPLDNTILSSVDSPPTSPAQRSNCAASVG